MPTNFPMQHVESLRLHKDEIASVHRDIDDLYSTRGATSMPRVNQSGRIRSLLPANAGDADSIYSEDEEIASQMIRAPERQRSLPIARTSHLHSSNADPVADPFPTGEIHASLHSRTPVDQLHGTDRRLQSSISATGQVEPVPESPEPIPTMDEQEEEERSSDDGKSKKKKKKRGRNRKRSRRKSDWSKI